MNKFNIFKSFIEACSLEDIKLWASKRKFDLDILHSLKIGICNEQAMQKLKEKYGLKNLKEAGFLNKIDKWKYYNRIIIPYNEYYFAARDTISSKYKNLFPKGLSKKMFFIEGKIGTDFYITEGETDAIRLKHIFKESNIISVGGAKSKKIFDDIIKKADEYNASRIVFVYDNDEPGREAVKSIISYLSDYRKRDLIEDKLFELKFDNTKKDIDEFFVGGGHVESLEYRKIELHKKESIPNTLYDQRIILPIDNYYSNAQRFYEFQPYFYDEVGLFWFWDKKKSKFIQLDDTDVIRIYDKILGFQGQTVNAKIKNHTLEAMRRVGRELKPEEAKVKWIQFKDKAYDLKGHIHQVTPKYFFTNPIPWDIGESSETPNLDKLFKEWVGEQYVNTLYEIIAYSCYRSYPLQTLFCLYGSGRNGKSCFLKIMKNFLGGDNICSTELDLLVDTRFESFKLFKKLACFMGETNMGTMTKSSLLKKLVGGDLIGFEKKGKDPFDSENYAKIVIASNNLPTSDDTSEGFYRRWLIIDFPNEFPEGKDIVEKIPIQEYNNLAKKITELLPKLLECGKFTNQGTIKERETKYIMSSNPFPEFIKLCCEVDESAFVSHNELYNAYCFFLKKHKKRRVKPKEFKIAMTNEGFFAERTNKKIGKNEFGESIFKNIWWVEGIALKRNWQNCSDCTNCTQNLELDITYEELSEKKKHKRNMWNKPTFNLHHKCFVDGCNSRETKFDDSGVPYCEEHWDQMALKKANEEEVK